MKSLLRLVRILDGILRSFQNKLHLGEFSLNGPAGWTADTPGNFIALTFVTVLITFICHRTLIRPTNDHCF